MTEEDKAALTDKVYLGDGVYAGFDGYSVVLWLDSTGTWGVNAMGLEPPVLASLELYIARIKEANAT